MKPSLYFRALLGEMIPIPDMTAAEIMKIETGIRDLLEAIEEAGDCLCWDGWHGQGWGMCSHNQRIMRAAESLKSK